MHLKSVSCLLLVCLLPAGKFLLLSAKAQVFSNIFRFRCAVTCVVFSRGRENAYDNQYYEITTSQLQQQCIAIHNRYRAMHGAGPLQYDSQVSERKSDPWEEPWISKCIHISLRVRD